ncbi:MAG: Sec-independent protein translocase subunit TatA/TatB [Leptospirales bacterium]
MLGVGWPDLLFIGIILALVIKPEEWPRVARIAGKWLRTIRRQAGPVLAELRTISSGIMEDEKPSRPQVAAPEQWDPMPQSYQKGGEPRDFSSDIRHDR